jgi:hypothetical protein
MIRSKASGSTFTQRAFAQNQTETPTSSRSTGLYLEGHSELQESPILQKATRNRSKAQVQQSIVAPQTVLTDPISVNSYHKDLKIPLTPSTTNRRSRVPRRSPIHTPSNRGHPYFIPTKRRRRWSPGGISFPSIAQDFGHVETIDLSSVEQPVFKKRSTTQSPTATGLSPETMSLADDDSVQFLYSRSKVASPLALSSPLRETSDCLARNMPKTPITNRSRNSIRSDAYISPCSQVNPPKLTLVTSGAVQQPWEHELQKLVHRHNEKLEEEFMLKEEVRALGCS